MWKWENGVYPNWFKAKVLVWSRYHGLVKTHSESAAAEAAKRKR